MGGSIYHSGVKYNRLVSEGGGGSATSFSELSDVSISNPQNGQVPVYNSTSHKWENGNSSAGSEIDDTTTANNKTWSSQKINLEISQLSGSLVGLDDVDISNPADGQVLTYDDDSDEWTNAPIPSEIDDSTTGSTNTWSATKIQLELNQLSGSFAGLDDVAVSSPQNGQVPKYNSTTGKWENDDNDEATWGSISGTLSNQTDLATALSGKIDASEKGANSGVATLDNTGRVPASQLPSYVDDSIEGYYNTTDHKFYEESTYETEITGEGGKIYVSLDTNKMYRWSGSTFVEVSESVALGETQGTAYEGNKGKANANNISDIQGVIPSNATTSNKLATAAEVGSLSSLDTTTKTDLVSAVNETYAGLHTMAPTPASGLTEDSVVTYVQGKKSVPTNEEVPSVFAIANWSNLKRIRVMCPASILASAHTGIGTWDDTTNEADWWQNDNFKYLDPTYKQQVLHPNGYDVDFDIKADPAAGEVITLGGWRVDTTTGKICIKFANYVVDPGHATIAVDLTFTRTDIVEVVS